MNDDEVRLQPGPVHAHPLVVLIRVVPSRCQIHHLEATVGETCGKHAAHVRIDSLVVVCTESDRWNPKEDNTIGFRGFSTFTRGPRKPIVL